MSNKFGGAWTEAKLEILKDYLNFYLTALKNQKFKKVYIDCFAGSGKISLSEEVTIDGSTKMVLDLDNKFDEYYFIEKDNDNYTKLEMLKAKYPELKINVYKGDCNSILPNVLNSINWKYTRGVVFIDPYATGLSYDTLKLVANTKSVDVWYLFPIMAINRMLEKTKKIDNSWKETLNNCFGTEDWEQELYNVSKQMNIFENTEYERVTLSDIQDYIYARMKTIFPYVSDKYIKLKNSKNSPLFLLFLLVSNTNAIGLVKKVENYILKQK